jgi:DNA-binding NarL/FixJ family response regulator
MCVEPAGTIKIAFGRLPRLLGDIVTGIIDGQPDMRLMGQHCDASTIDGLVRRDEVDVVICDEGDAGAKTARDLLREHRRLKLLLLSDNGRAAEMRWLEPRVVRCSAVSADGLMQLIRSHGSGDGLP